MKITPKQPVLILGYSSVVPCSRYRCSNLVIFLDRINLDTQIKFVSSKDVNWPAWKDPISGSG